MVTTWSWTGALLGACLAAGVLLVAAGLPGRRRPDLSTRLEPYVRDTAPPSRLLTPQAPVAWSLTGFAAPLFRRAGRVVEQVLGGAGSVRRRLERAGLAVDVEGFRIQQALWGASFGVAAAFLASLLWWRRGTGLLPLVLLVLAAVAAGVVARDQLLTRVVQKREKRILQEFPAIAELLALSVTAGEGAAAALERVTRLSRGDLSSELSICLAEARAGSSLTQSLEGLSDRTGLSSLARFVDGIVVAVERGSPLADVLRAQAQDARETGRQALIEEGGKREIAMMVTSAT